MNKLWLVLFTCMLLVISATGCNKDDPEFIDASGANDFRISPTESNDSAGTTAIDISGSDTTPVPGSGTYDTQQQSTADVDIDLASMNNTMMVSMIDNIYANANDYLGKVIKMAAGYYVNYNPDSREFYHFVIYFDDAACCSYGFEFGFADGDFNIDNMPVNGTNVEVTGVFTRGTAGGETYYYLEALDFRVS